MSLPTPSPLVLSPLATLRRSIVSAAAGVAVAALLATSALAIEPAGVVVPPRPPVDGTNEAPDDNGTDVDPDVDPASTSDLNSAPRPLNLAQLAPRLGAAMRVGQRLLETYTRTADQTQHTFLDGAAQGDEQRIIFTRERERTRTVQELDPWTGAAVAWQDTFNRHRMISKYEGRDPSESIETSEGLTLAFRVVDGWARVDETVLMPDADRRDLELPELPLPCFPTGKPLKPGLRWEFSLDDARLFHYRPNYLVTDASVCAELTRLRHRDRVGDTHVFVGPVATVYLSATGRLVRDSDNDGVANENDTTELNYTQSVRLDIDLGLNLIVAWRTDGSASFTFASGARETRGQATLTLDATWQPIVDEQTEQTVREAMERVAARKAAAEAEAAAQDE